MMRVMLREFRSRGWKFEEAWSSAIQRLRIAPGMSDEEIEEFIGWKAALDWSKAYWSFWYAGLEPPAPVYASSPTALLVLTATVGADQISGSESRSSVMAPESIAEAPERPESRALAV